MPNESSHAVPLDGITLRSNGDVVKQVLILGGLIVSFENIDGALVGTHSEVNLRQLAQLERQMRAMFAEGWEMGL